MTNAMLREKPGAGSPHVLQTSRGLMTALTTAASLTSFAQTVEVLFDCYRTEGPGTALSGVNGGRTLEIGLETWAPHFRNIAFEDCDLIHNNGGALSVHLGGPAPVEDVLYRNIRIEYAASDRPSVLQKGRDAKYTGKAPWSGCYIIVQNKRMFEPRGMYAGVEGYPDPAKEPFGTFGRVTFEDIAVTVGEGAATPGVHIRAEPGSSFGKIEARNVTINGKEQTL